MTEQLFSDSEKQLLIRLTDDTLAYVPVTGQGWQCRLDDIAWTSSRISPRGVHEVKLHAPDGRVVAAVDEFEQVERFYLALIRQLALRPFLDPVRGSVPGHVRHLEQILRLADQSRQAGETWEALHVEDSGMAIATPAALLLVPAAGPGTPWSPLRVPWSDLSGIRRRLASSLVPRSVVRFYRREDYVDLFLQRVPEELFAGCDHHLREAGAATYAPLGAEAADPDLLLTYSWEILGARDAGLLDPGETVIACAYGMGLGAISGERRGSSLPEAPDHNAPGADPLALAATPAALAALSTGPVAGEEGSPPARIRTDLILTTRELIQIDHFSNGRLVSTRAQLDVYHLPIVRRSGSTLRLGSFELQTDAQQPMDIAGDFVRRYCRYFAERFDPFAGEVEAASAPAPASAAEPRLPDPFASEVDEPRVVVPPGTGPWRP